MSDGPPFTVLDAELVSLMRQVNEPAPERLYRSRAARTREAAVDAPPAAELRSDAPKMSLNLLVRQGYESSVGAWVRQQGGRVVSEGARVLVTELPVTAIAALERLPGVRRAEAPKVLLPRLEECRGPATGLGRALERYKALTGENLTGEGVVLGIIDTGVDWSHPDFLDEKGASRIELFLHAYEDGSFISHYETYTRAALNRALAGKRKVPQGDPDGHGTHCASIAAGNGRASAGRFCGVAPRAALMAVRNEHLLDNHTIRAIRDIFKKAGKRPAVISLSLGHHYGAHDGTAPLENVIAEQSGPGRIVVVAAGNEREAGVHWHGELIEGEDLAVSFRIGDGAEQYVDLWVPRGDEVEVFVESPDGALIPLNQGPAATSFGTCTATWRRDLINLDSNLHVVVKQGQVDRLWKIRLRPHTVLHGEVHAWSGTINRTSVPLFPGVADRRYSLGIPGTEERAITVGSWVCRNTYEGDGGAVLTKLQVGQLSPFSSEGPTRHGVLKPDIAAPGQYITAALASNSRKWKDSKYKPQRYPSAPYITLEGTSMATPFVAGVIALMLQREPRLTPEEIRQRLRITARRDADTGRVWGPGFGFGKIDVEALLGYEAEED